MDGGADGLDAYRRLVVEALPFLRPGSPLMTELGDGQSEAVAELFRKAGWRVESVWPDYSGRPRILIALR